MSRNRRLRTAVLTTTVFGLALGVYGHFVDHRSWWTGIWHALVISAVLMLPIYYFSLASRERRRRRR